MAGAPVIRLTAQAYQNTRSHADGFAFQILPANSPDLCLQTHITNLNRPRFVPCAHFIYNSWEKAREQLKLVYRYSGRGDYGQDAFRIAGFGRGVSASEAGRCMTLVSDQEPGILGWRECEGEEFVTETVWHDITPTVAAQGAGDQAEEPTSITLEVDETGVQMGSNTMALSTTTVVQYGESIEETVIVRAEPAYSLNVKYNPKFDRQLFTALPTNEDDMIRLQPLNLTRTCMSFGEYSPDEVDYYPSMLLDYCNTTDSRQHLVGIGWVAYNVEENQYSVLNRENWYVWPVLDRFNKQRLQ